MNTDIVASLKALLATLKADLQKDFYPALATLLQTIAKALPANPADPIQQVAFQAALLAAITQFNASLTADIPALSADVRNSVAGWLSTEAASLLTTLTPTITAAAASATATATSVAGLPPAQK
jgi:hypothetical protein